MKNMMNSEHQDTSETEEKRQEVLDKEWDELLKRNLSNTENLTKYIFSLASGGLGVSLVVVKDLNFLASADFKYILFLSWGAFLITIICALISFLTSLRGIDKELAHIVQEYNQESEATTEKQRNPPAKLTKRLRYLSVFFCIIGIISTPLFVALNILNFKSPC